MDADHGADKELFSSISARLGEGEALAVAEEMLISPKAKDAVAKIISISSDSTTVYAAYGAVRIANLDPRWEDNADLTIAMQMTRANEELKRLKAIDERIKHFQPSEFSKNLDKLFGKTRYAPLSLNLGFPTAHHHRSLAPMPPGILVPFPSEIKTKSVDLLVARRVLGDYLSKARACIGAKEATGIERLERMIAQEYVGLSKTVNSSKCRITSEGGLLSDERPKPPRGTDQGAMFRSASASRARVSG